MMNNKENAPYESVAAIASDEAQADPKQTDAAPVIPFNRYVDFGGRIPVPRRGEVLVLPLGGLGRIGMNWTLYGHDGRWLLVDAGIAFPGKDLVGVDALVPDPAHLGPILERLDALVVTHAHEDHIGAIHRLWPAVINCPVYVTPFAAGILERRFDEAGTRDAIDLRRYPVGGTFTIGPFTVRSVRMTHSIPEPVSLAITTSAGTVVHTGDWKIDPDPQIGQPTDFDALRAIGDAGVLAMMADSTNAHKEMPTTSEGEVRQAFRHIMKERRGLVVVCCFATNVARVASALVTAAAAGRKTALMGRSMKNGEETARSVGILQGVPEPLADVTHLRGLDRREMAVVCTGTQGEERAALARMARGTSPIRLEAGDTVVLSSRVIPGNDEAVGKIIGQLKKRGVDVVTSDKLVHGFPVHVSGHPGRGDLRTLYGLVRPRHAIPVHGTLAFQEAHARLARECGCERAVVAEENEVITVSERGIRVLGHLPVPMLHIASEEDTSRSRGAQRRPARKAVG